MSDVSTESPTATFKGKKKARRASIAVQRPDPVQGPPITWTNNQVRSDSAWVSKDDKLNIIRFQHFLDHAPKIVLPVTLPMMQKPLTPAGWKKLEEITDKLLDSSQPARCTSAQYLDRNGNPLLFYFGRRLVRDDDKNNVRVPVKNQYDGQTLEDIERVLREDKTVKLVRDGLSDLKCENYQLAAQSLASDTKLHTLFDETRHEGKNEMVYMVPTSGSTDASDSESDMSISDEEDNHGGCGDQDVDIPYHEPEDMDEDDNYVDLDDSYPVPDGSIEYVCEEDNEINMQAYVTPDSSIQGSEQTEQAGVLHLVHGWIQQAHPERGLYISGDITTSSTSIAAAGSHYVLTESIARTVGLAFKTVFPTWYDTYQKAFEAGIWFPDDPGPFLGRAIVYKLQGKLHRDRHDVGPSVSFPVGQFTGGEMVFPQLKTKLQYSPGDFCIFFSSTIYHKVAPFFPLPQTPEQAANNITPGRIGSVFFFPKESLRILEGKPKRWGYRTAFGRNEHLLARQNKRKAKAST